MGKEKHNKKNKSNVFKVAGAKSLKVKNKPKPVSSQLKKITEINRKLIKDIDNQLVKLHTKLTQPSKAAAQNTENRPLPSVDIKKTPVETSEATEKITEINRKLIKDIDNQLVKLQTKLTQLS